jgi:hypothetical protein
MLRAALRAALVALASLAVPSHAAITLELRVDSQVRDDVAVHVAATNVGDEPAEQVWPEARLAGATARGDTPASLAPGFRATWDLTLLRPRELGTFALIVQLHYADAFGARRSVPAVHQVRTAVTPSLDTALTVEAQPVIERGLATVRLVNRETTAVAGTLHVLAGVDLAVAPAEREIAVAPQGTIEVPLTIENRGALPDSTAALWAYATFPRGTHVESIAAHTAVPIVSPATPAAQSAASVALTLAIVAALGLALWGARRLAAGPRGATTRAERRRDR